jgi:hypothetical protein
MGVIDVDIPPQNIPNFRKRARVAHEIQKDLVQAEEVRVMHAAVDAKLMPGRAEPAICLQPVTTSATR